MSYDQVKQASKTIIGIKQAVKAMYLWTSNSSFCRNRCRQMGNRSGHSSRERNRCTSQLRRFKERTW